MGDELAAEDDSREWAEWAEAGAAPAGRGAPGRERGFAWRERAGAGPASPGPALGVAARGALERGRNALESDKRRIEIRSEAT